MVNWLDILFLHCPKWHDHYLPIGKFSYVNIIPSGVFGMADLLDRKGHKVRIMHLGVERYLHGDEAPLKYVRERKPRVVALDLFWHHQSYDVVETARAVREILPGAVIVLGGITATFFTGEILREFPFIDAVITGDGEEPILRFMETVKSLPPRGEASQDGGGGPAGFADALPYEKLIELPNLAARWRGEVVRTPGECVTGRSLMEGLNFYRLELLKDFGTYLEVGGIPPLWVHGRSDKWHRSSLDRLTRVFFPVTGRGCPQVCTWCGKQERSGFVFLDPAPVLSNIRKALAQGLESLYFNYDPLSGGTDYYQKLFRELRKSLDTAKIPAYFECWGLPSPGFIDEFHQTFPDGILAFSPESGSEEVRKLNRGSAFTNEELFQVLDLLAQKEVKVDLFFSAGLPGENLEKFGQTAGMIRHILLNYMHIDALILSSIQMEPGSPWHRDPEKFGIVSGRKGFLDFYKAHGPGGGGSFTSLGYMIPGYFPQKYNVQTIEDFEKRILRLRCNTMCFMNTLSTHSGIPSACIRQMAGERLEGGLLEAVSRSFLG
jgi:radical SAM superfamily enzyme YgiQ (UPF0313 family)